MSTFESDYMNFYERFVWYSFAPIRGVIRVLRWYCRNPSRVFIHLTAVYLVAAVSVFLVVRAKFPFWSRQPVFHAGLFMLRFWWFLYPIGVVQNSSHRELIAEISREPFSRWYIRDIVRYQWKHPSRYSRSELAECRDFLADHFYSRRRNGVLYRPTENWLNPFEDAKSRLSVFRGETLPNTRLRPICGIMGSYPLRMRLFNEKWREIKMNYVDYLCVARGQRRQGLAEKLIYTHYCWSMFEQLRRGSGGCSQLFKREDGSSGNWWQMGIMPIWRYTAVGVCLGNDANASANYPYLSLENAWLKWEIEALPRSFRLSDADSVQVIQEVMQRIQTERIRETRENGDKGHTAKQKTMLITPEWSGLAKMIQRKQLIIHVLRDELTFEILGCYCWKKNDTFYCDGEPCSMTSTTVKSSIPSIELQCAVWFGKDRQHSLFFSGFRESTERIFREMYIHDTENTSDDNSKDKPHSNTVLNSLVVWFESTADAMRLVERIREKSDEVMTTPMAYFSHNFCIPSVNASEVVAIGV